MPDLGAASFHHQFLETRKIHLESRSLDAAGLQSTLSRLSSLWDAAA